MNVAGVEQNVRNEGEHRARPPAPLEGVRHRFIQTSRLRTHIAEAGSGEPVVLLHGWPQHWYAWRQVIPLLAQRHRVICPDLRGFGWTEVPRTGYSTDDLVDDLIALLDALALEKVWVVGHELGGRLGFHFCLREPNRVRGYVALNALHPYWSARRLAPQAWRQWWTVFVETPLLGRAVLRHLPTFTRTLFRLGNPNLAARDASAVEQYISSLCEPDRSRAAERVQTQFAYRELIPTLLGKYRSTRLTTPTLMLNGTKDFALSPAELGGYEPYADDLRVELVTSAGHFLPEERPRLVADTVARFFSALMEQSANTTGRVGEASRVGEDVGRDHPAVPGRERAEREPASARDA